MAYPRVCGGAASGLRIMSAMRGLSPRMRGSLDKISLIIFSIGPIPAYAGEPYSAIAGGAGRRAYPRVCGGAENIMILITAILGLSPRMRGSPP